MATQHFRNLNFTEDARRAKRLHLSETPSNFCFCREPFTLCCVRLMKAMSRTLELRSNGTSARHGGLSDEELLIRYRHTDDRELFAELVYRYERELFAYLARYLGDRQQAEDAFQATFLQVHLKGDSFESDRKFRPWLYTIATRQAIDIRTAQPTAQDG